MLRMLQPTQFKPWTLPFIVLALSAPAAFAFLFGGVAAGLLVGALTAAVVVVLASRAGFDEPIEVGAPPRDRYEVLVVLLTPIEEPGVSEELIQIAREGARSTGDPDREPELLLVAPALNRPIAHWLSDVDEARFDAQRLLAISLGALATLEARGAVGDTDPVTAVEDALRTFPAQDVVFITAEEDGGDEIEDVRRRLDRPIRGAGWLIRADQPLHRSPVDP